MMFSLLKYSSITVSVMLLLCSCKNADKVHDRRIDDLLNVPDQKTLEKTIKDEDLNVFRGLNQLSSHTYAIEYPFDKFNNCYAFYEYNDNGTPYSVTYVWGDSIVALIETNNNTEGNIYTDKQVNETYYSIEAVNDKERYRHMDWLFMDIVQTVKKQSDLCGNYQISDNLKEDGLLWKNFSAFSKRVKYHADYTYLNEFNSDVKVVLYFPSNNFCE